MLVARFERVRLQLSSPGDDVASLKTKLSAAGASAEEFVFQGTPVTGTLADAGLEAEASFEAVVKG